MLITISLTIYICRMCRVHAYSSNSHSVMIAGTYSYRILELVNHQMGKGIGRKYYIDSLLGGSFQYHVFRDERDEIISSVMHILLNDV